MEASLVVRWVAGPANGRWMLRTPSDGGGGRGIGCFQASLASDALGAGCWVLRAACAGLGLRGVGSVWAFAAACELAGSAMCNAMD